MSRRLNEATDASVLDEIVRQPMVKTAEETVNAIQSGGRSAVVPSEHCVYRLKGCGNFVNQEGFRYDFPGFPVQAVEGVEGGQEIRGCAFRHTAVRELFMTDKVCQLLADHSLQVGNIPVGMYQYNIDQEPFPKVPKFCGVFRTIGEKRLASDLLTGLELLLPHFFPHLMSEEIFGLYAHDRFQLSNSSVMELLPTWKACCTSSRPKNPLDLRKHALPEVVPTADSMLPVLDRWKTVWQTNCKQLHTILPLTECHAAEFGCLFATLYWKLGHEVGFFKRLLEDNNINWGYFIDHNPFEPHCNSHPNNFVVIPEVYSKNNQFLAAVDFDLAFTKQSFCSPYTGNADDDLFASWTLSEHQEMERALAGEQSNTGVILTSGMISKIAAALDPPHDALRWAVRDTMLSGYRSAYYKLKDDVLMPPPEIYQGMRNLVNLALCIVDN